MKVFFSHFLCANINQYSAQSVQVCTVCKKPVTRHFFSVSYIFLSLGHLHFGSFMSPQPTLLATSTNSRQDSGSLYRLLKRTLEPTGHCNMFNTDHILVTILLG